MVQLTIQVRAKTCYSNAGKIKTLSVDSYQRVEEIVEQGSRLYKNGNELPLNSSFASNNVQNGDILESCSSPLMSALLSAVLKDFNDIQKVPEPERSKETLEPLLGGAKLDPWPNRWSKDSIKSRVICLAMIKKVIQRDERFANDTVPKIETLQELYDFMQTVWNKNGSVGHNTMAHVFKPSAKNANGKPSTCWQMMEHKFVLAQRIRRSCATTGQDWIEVFVETESNRHETATTNATTPSSSRRSNRRANATPQQPRRTLPTPPSNARGATAAVQCATASCHLLAEHTCLEPNCPFQEQLTCNPCFFGNHPAHIRNHARIPLTDPRVKAIIKEKNKKGYCPEYQSGPYAILCCLLEASKEQQGGQRELSLSESKLKKLAQKRCRSNLYDRQARGRSAFACIEGLADKQLVRKEIVQYREEALFSLLPEGEAMAKWCLDFEQMTEQVLKDRTVTRLQAPCPKNLTLLVDTREDATYSNRLQESCFDDGYPCEQRELPAGDYLFVRKSGDENKDNEVVLPLVIERKSWSDFADSVHGAGKGHQRLDCVKIGGVGQCSNGRCQLCRMKRSGCEKVMFIIEGARCLNRDDEDKCSDGKRCQHCRELQERHNTIQEDLEAIIYDLQATHGCLIHFTRNFNDTIQSLKMIYRLFSSENGGGGIQQHHQDDDLQRAIQLSLGAAASSPPTSNTPKLTYKEFASNALKYKTRPPLRNGKKKKDVRRLGTETFIRGICEDRVLATISTTTNETTGQKDLNQSFDEAAAAEAPPAVELLDSDSDDDDEFPESQNSVEVLEFLPPKAASKQAKCIDSDSDDIVVVEETIGNSPNGVSPAPGMFVLTGLYEYDRDFFKDINKIWQHMYRTMSNVSSDDFRKSVSDKLLSIQKDQMPLVHRDSILYWTLRIPLFENVLLHNARTSQCVNHLTNRWDNGRSFPSSRGRTLGSTDSGQKSRRDRVGRSASTITQQSNKDIVVIDDNVGVTNRRRDLVGTSSKGSTPVAHQDTRAQQKVNYQNTPVYTINDDDDELTVLPTPSSRATRPSETARNGSETSKKPACSRGKPPRPDRKAPPVYAIDPPVGERNVGSGRKKQPQKDIEHAGTSTQPRVAAVTTPTRSTRKPPPKYSADTNKASRNVRPDPSISNTDLAIREARLRRFGSSETPSSRKRSPLHCTPSTWRCETCTYDENPAHLLSCGVCYTDKSSISVSGPAHKRSRPDSTLSTWKCATCTYAENPLHLSSCEICKTDNSSILLMPGRQSTPSTWTCGKCTYGENPLHLASCKVCETHKNPRPQAVSTPPHKGSRPRFTPTTWRCGDCTYGENPLHLASCEMCGAGNSSNSGIRPESISSIAMGLSKAVKPDAYISKSSPASIQRRIRCGACGLDGHNRGSATASNCPAFNNQEEIDLRNKKLEAAKKKAKEAAKEAKDFESRKEASDMAQEQRAQELQRLLALQQQHIEEGRRNAENELKRRKKAAERAKKRAERLDK